MRDINEFIAKYGTSCATVMVNQILSNIEEGKKTSPELIKETREMMQELRIALANEWTNQKLGE